MQSQKPYIIAMTDLVLTENAAKRIAEIKSDNTPYFRLKVLGGGCSGFSYNMDLVSEIKEDDLVIAQGDEKMLVDPISLEYLKGSTVDYVEELVGASFKVINPNAASSCGCGVSFAV